MDCLGKDFTKIFESSGKRNSKNTILILPEKISDETVNIVLNKGADARSEVAALWTKHLAAGIKESKKAIDEVTEHEIANP